MSRDGYLPPGTEYGDIPGMFDPDDPSCACSHPRSEHTGHGESCEHDEGDDELCPCSGFEPPDAY